MIYSIVLCILVIIVLKKLLFKNEFSLIPGPINLPFVGALYLLNNDHMDKCFYKLYKKYGDIYYMKFGVYDCVVLNSFKLIKQVFVEQSEFTFRRFPIKSIQKICKNLDMAIHPNPEFWKRSRQIIMSSLSKGKIGSLDQVYHFRYTILEDNLKKLIKSNNIITLEKEFMRFGFGVVFSSLFGEGNDLDNNEVEILVGSINLLFGELPKVSDILPIPECLVNYKEILKSADYIMGLIQSVIDKILKTYNRDSPTCALHHIIKSIEDQDDPKLITNESLSYFVFDLFLAGVETTCRAVEWTIILMVNNPQCQNELYNELKSVGIQYPLLSDRSKYTYLNASFKELMRFRPPAPIVPPHVNTEPIVVDNFTIPKNTLIIANLGSANFNPQTYKDPLTFNPHRFIGENSEQSPIPFNIGPRSCPFQNLAQEEIFIVLTRLFQTFKFESPIPNKLLSEETILKLSLQPLNTLSVKVQLREENNLLLYK